MQIKQFPVNSLQVNCYVVSDEHEAIIVDPGEASAQVLNFLRENNLQVVAIINTHGHADHIAGNAWFAEQTKAPLFVHELEVPYLKDPNLHLGSFIQMNVPESKPERTLKDGDKVTFGAASLEVIHTPGHSPGGICLYAPGVLFSGDTLFRSSVGRTDLPQGDQTVLSQSLKRLALLPPETVVYPGHGPSTTIGYELEVNPFL